MLTKEAILLIFDKIQNCFRNLTVKGLVCNCFIIIPLIIIHFAVPGTTVPNQVNDVLTNTEDIPNSLPNSSATTPVTKENPLSPKTPTALRSTSQVFK